MLGRLDSEYFAGGDFVLDEAAARSVIEREVAQRYEMSADEAALGIVTVIDSTMARLLWEVMIASGYDPRDFALLAFGGAGPPHACSVARTIGVREVVVPPNPGTFSAYGMITADIRRDFERMVFGRDADADLTVAFAELERTVRGELESQHTGYARVDYRRFVELRYAGQRHPLLVEIETSDGEQSCNVDAVRAAFHDKHHRLYGFRRDTSPVEFLRIQVSAVGRVPRFESINGTRRAGPAIAPTRRRQYLKDGWCVTPVFQRSTLVPGATLPGPCLVEEPTSTTFVPPDCVCDVDLRSNLRISVPPPSGQRAMTAMQIDPITREVLQNRLTAIVREMSITLQRAAYSPIIYEVKDFSSVLLRPCGDLVAQAEGIPGFLGAMPQLIPPLLERYPYAEMSPGDVFVSNDPYSANGTHKNDVNVIKPVFAGDRVFAFAVNKAHWTDIGGKESGSWSPDATNTYQEGISIPPLRLAERGLLNDELVEIILANTRLRENNLGDLMAQMSACNAAERRVHSLLTQYGAAEIDAYIDSLFAYTEAKIRNEIEGIPDGTYVGEDFVETDGISPDPIRVGVKIHVKGSDIEFDFTESGPQHGGACGNIPVVGTVSACRLALKCLLAPSVGANEGLYRPMAVVTIPGTMTHPLHPAPCTTWATSCARSSNQSSKLSVR